MSQHEAADVVRTYCAAWLTGDAMAVLAMYHRDLELEWPGRHRLSGRHVGKAAAIDALIDLQAVTNRRPLEILDVLEGEHSVVVLVVERWTTVADDTEGDSIDVLRALEYTVADGQLRTCRVFEADQPSVDDWITRNEPPDPTPSSPPGSESNGERNATG